MIMSNDFFGLILDKGREKYGWTIWMEQERKRKKKAQPKGKKKQSPNKPIFRFWP